MGFQIWSLTIPLLAFLSSLSNNTPKMASTTGVNSFNKSKEDFIWFIKKATSNRKRDAHSELYHALLKMFVDADTNYDGLVSRESFSKLVDKAASIPRAYGYAPPDSELYKSDEERDAARKKMFDSMDLKSTGVITFDEWYRFSMEHIAAKTATIAPHPILDHGSKAEYLEFIKKASSTSNPENLELYWFLVEIFTDEDSNKDGLITKRAFPAMMAKLMETPLKHQLSHPDKEMTQEDEDKKIAHLEKLLVENNPRKDEKMTLDEWVQFALEKVLKKFA